MYAVNLFCLAMRPCSQAPDTLFCGFVKDQHIQFAYDSLCRIADFAVGMRHFSAACAAAQGQVGYNNCPTHVIF
jgi:hypothetical protein